MKCNKLSNKPKRNCNKILIKYNRINNMMTIVLVTGKHNAILF